MLRSAGHTPSHSTCFAWLCRCHSVQLTCTLLDHIVFCSGTVYSLIILPNLMETWRCGFFPFIHRGEQRGGYFIWAQQVLGQEASTSSSAINKAGSLLLPNKTKYVGVLVGSKFYLSFDTFLSSCWFLYWDIWLLFHLTKTITGHLLDHICTLSPTLVVFYSAGIGFKHFGMGARMFLVYYLPGTISLTA